MTHFSSIKLPSQKELSFCITCKNRSHQIKRTLVSNIKNNIKDKKYIEFVVVDFGSTDGLQSWIIDNFRQELDCNYLVYLYTEESNFWHMSVAKNTAHLLSSGKICVNLDCDNFTGKRGGNFILKKFNSCQKSMILHQFSGFWGDGTCGRISLLKKHFLKLGGYDESFEPMGYQDIDLLVRANKLGLKYVKESNSNYNDAIKNPKSSGTQFCNTNTSWRQMESNNRKKSKKNILENNFVANKTKEVIGISENIFKYSNGSLLDLSPDHFLA